MGENDPAVVALRALVRIPTVSSPVEDENDPAVFARFREELRAQFPLLHEHLTVTPIERDGLLFHWPGRSSERPVVLMAHQDVVPIDPEAPWQHEPFAADLEDGIIWGRGTLDDKGSLVAICAAVEQLLGADFTPAQDVWLSFGAREEVSGADALTAVQTLRDRGIEPWFVLDEGGALASEAFPGISQVFGVIGVTEKGTTTIELVAEGAGGHSSTPAPNGPTTRIARAVLRLERNQFASRLPQPTIEMFERIAPYAPIALRPLLASTAKAPKVLAQVLTRLGPETAAMTRTTMAVTQLSGSPAHNVIASRATAAVNLRILIGDTVATAVEHVRRAINDASITLNVLDANEPSPLSPVDDPAFNLLADTIREVFPSVVPTPYVMMAATDARFFTSICSRVYRFTPFAMDKSQREAIHSFDERIGVDAFCAGVDWYRRLLENIT